MDLRCMGGCGAYPYVQQWHLWHGGYCNKCWKRHEASLARIAEMQSRNEELDQRIKRDDFKLKVLCAFMFVMIGVIWLQDLWKKL